MDTSLIILLSLFLISMIYVIFVIVSLIVSLIVKKKKISNYIKTNPGCVQMRICTHTYASDYNIIISSVNDEKPVFDEKFLYLVPGKNKIIVKYNAENKNKKTYPMIGALIGGLIGVIISAANLSHTIKDKKKLESQNEITIDIETKRYGDYEMKVDPYTGAINIIHLQSEKPDIKSYS